MINNNLLAGLRHCQVTDLKKGKINNHDAALLIIASTSGGIAAPKDVIKHLQNWTNSSRQFTYLWNRSQYGGYEFVGKNINSVFNTVYHHPSKSSRRPWDGNDCVTNRRTYWYRVKTGCYSLTLEGYRRLKELQEQLS